MAEVSLFPVTPDLASTARQLAQLKRAIDDRAELGSRAVHINTLSRDLEQQLHTLQQEIAYLTANSAIPEATLCQIGTFIQLVRRTIMVATEL